MIYWEMNFILFLLNRRIQRMKGKFSSSYLPSKPLLFCGLSYSLFFVIQKRPWKQHPSHTQISEKKLLLGKGELMSWILEKEKDFCREGGFWRAERELLCVSGVDGRLGLYSYAVAQQWSGLWCGNTWVPDIMVFGAVIKFGTRECSDSNGPDRLGLWTS